jgi:hypothetical protein
MKKDRFDLEQDIMKCWNITEELQNLYSAENLSEDEQQNYLLGLITIYEVKFQKLWDSFSDCVKAKEL